MLFMAEIIPFSRRFYCVYRHGLAIYRHTALTSCFRFIAKELGGITGTVTLKQAMDAGFEVVTR